MGFWSFKCFLLLPHGPDTVAADEELGEMSARILKHLPVTFPRCKKQPVNFAPGTLGPCDAFVCVQAVKIRTQEGVRAALVSKEFAALAP